MEHWNALEFTEFNSIGTGAGAYAFIVAGVVVYIGRSKCMWMRLRNHKLLKKLRAETEEIAVRISMGWEDYDKEKELVKQYQPRYNCEYIDKWK